VEDIDFINEINNGKEFSKGDILKVLIRREQYYNEDEKKLKTLHFIETVIKHAKPKKYVQGSLFE
jgi:hypothetical protein